MDSINICWMNWIRLCLQFLGSYTEKAVSSFWMPFFSVLDFYQVLSESWSWGSEIGRERRKLCVCVCSLSICPGAGEWRKSSLTRAEAFRVFSFPFEAILSVIYEMIQFDKLA